MPAAIVTEELTRSFDRDRAVDGLSLEVGTGEVLALLGPNGAGKTTTVRLLNGILSPDSGRAEVLGFDPYREGDLLRQRTGVLTENAGLDDRLTARENLEAAAGLRRMRDAGPRIDDLLERFGMGDRADKLVRGASTGQRKRLALARELLHDPEVLYLDEPTSGLDPHATRDVVELIGGLAAEHGRTIVLCTHFLAEAGRLADRMAIMVDGHALAYGTPAGLAAEMWSHLRVDVEAEQPLDHEATEAVRGSPGVVTVEPKPQGATVEVVDADVVPDLVRTLVRAGVDVRACTPHPAALEDVYFEVLRRHGYSAEVVAGAVGDGRARPGDDGDGNAPTEPVAWPLADTEVAS